MIISNEHKFIYFFSIGNTATRSMQAILSEYHDDPDITIDFSGAADVEEQVKKHGNLDNYKIPTQKYFLDREVTPRYLKKLFTFLGREEQWKEYKKYATVRHPHALIESLARSNHLGYLINWYEIGECIRICEHQFRGHGWDPVTIERGQYNAYCDIGGKQMIDKFLKIELLADALKEEFPFVETEKLQHFRHDYKIEKVTQWKQSERDLITSVWHNDFEHLGYLRPESKQENEE